MSENTTETSTQDTGQTEQGARDDIRQEQAMNDPKPTDNQTGTTVESIEEAKKYRKRAQKAEGERDALAEQLHATQGLLTGARHSILTEQLKAAGMIHPEDFATFVDTPTDDYFTEDGSPDTDKITKAIQTLKGKRYELFEHAMLPPAVPQTDHRKPGIDNLRSPLADALRGE